MLYYIRYRSTDSPADAEAVVEANSPTEAMVKFQHAGDGGTKGRRGEVVTSVRAEEGCCEYGA
jgi:hypothetical protein